MQRRFKRVVQLAARTGASRRGAPWEALSWMVYWTFKIGLNSLRSLGETGFAPAEGSRPPTTQPLNSETPHPSRRRASLRSGLPRKAQQDRRGIDYRKFESRRLGTRRRFSWSERSQM